MEFFLNFYQNMPLHINPTAFEFGFFQIGWYALSYLVGFLVVYGLLKYRIKRKEEGTQIFNFQFLISKQFKNFNAQNSKQTLDNKYQIIATFFIYAICGVLIGGRLGYILFYNLPYYLNYPLEIISPYDFQNHISVGIYGMSYHGGLIGVIIAAWIFCRRYGVNFLQLADFIVPAVPAGYFFGRIGNFLNGELFGRIADSAWGMYFFDGKNIFLRYPSQLIEAFLEGTLIFFILWFSRNKKYLENKRLFFYLILYGIARFFAEFFREPDEQIGFLAGFLTLGQMFSLVMVFTGLLAFIFRKPPHLRAYARDIGS